MSILILLICGAFVSGIMYNRFETKQTYIMQGVDKLLRDNEGHWSFQMQKEFTQGLIGLNEGLRVPNVSEIKMNHTHEGRK